MKKGIARFTSFCLTAGLTIGVGSTVLLAGRTDNRDCRIQRKFLYSAAPVFYLITILLFARAAGPAEKRSTPGTGYFSVAANSVGTVRMFKRRQLRI